MEAQRTFRIGDIDVSPVWDGTLDTRLSYITNLDEASAARILAASGPEYGPDPLILPVRAFLIRTANRVILIDTGGGSSKGTRLGHLTTSLAAMGIGPGDIDTVAFTHMHRDHYCGLVDPAGNARFDRAQILLHRAEAEAWLDTPKARMHPRSQRHSDEVVEFLGRYGSRVQRVEDGDVAPGVTIMLAAGHTPGHSCFVVRSGGQSAVVIGDVVHLAAVQVPAPGTTMHYDTDPEMAVTTRRKVLGWCAGEGALVMGAHLPATGVGRMVVAGDGFRFVPA